MPASLHDVRNIVMKMPDVVEGVCFGTPTFYLRSKLILRMKEDGETLVVKRPIIQRDDLIEAEPSIFSVTDHYQKFPVILVSLPNINLVRLGQIISEAWLMCASKKQIAALNLAKLEAGKRQ
jgi:hypothetical protein